LKYKSANFGYIQGNMENEQKTSWLERPIHPALPAITNEFAIFAGIIILAIITRFYNLEARVMSHDESLHTYFSWLLYRGQGYQHTPMMHGPFQFHILALTYFIFGVSDLTARIPAVLFSIATVWMVWYWRRYLGNWGALVAGLMMVLSPYMLYYGRYVRNESYAGFAGIFLLYGILRYMDTGGKRYLYMVTLATVLHFTAKETAFIYTAQALLFLGIYFISRITRKPWEENPGLYRVFIIILAVVVLLGGIGVGLGYLSRNSGTIAGGETVVPANPTGTTSPLALPSSGIKPSEILLGLALLGMLAGVYVLLKGYGWKNILKERSFDLMLLLFTFVLPMLSAFLLDMFKSTLNVTIPTDAASVNALDARALGIIGAILILLFILSIAIGMLWNRDWWKYAVLFWGIFTILYTTVFTNAAGFFTGAIGSLGYWIVQQGVERGSQPVYYYFLVQIPIYEFLPAMGTILAIIVGAIKLYKRESPDVEQPASEFDDIALEEPEAVPNGEPIGADPVPGSNFGLFYGLMTWWCITSVVAFSFAGERMPWLTYHMAWPMILFTGWVMGVFIDTLVKQWTTSEKPGRMVLSILVLTVFILALFNTLRALFGANPPFQGTDLVQLQATASFLVPLACAILSGALLAYLMKDELVSLGIVVLFVLALVTFVSSVINGASLMSFASMGGADAALMSSGWLRFGTALVALAGSIIGVFILSRLQRGSTFISLFILTIFSLLLLQTARTSFRANYVLYDDAMEYLVYAHGATGVKDVMKQVEEVSKRTAGGLNAVVAYDASAPDTGVSWPLVWYLRDYTAQRSFDKPTRSLREAVAVIVDQKNFEQIEGALGNEFYRFDYIRMWWPNQDYFNLDRSRILNAITNPQIREGIFDIWFNRDYTEYAQATGSSAMTLTTWQPSDQMRLYIRKDIASKIWNYGVGPSQAPVTEDPYKAGSIMLAADQIFSSDRYPPGLNAPREIANGLNGDLYVADSRNHRILHIASDGSLLQEWGSFADIATGNAPQDTFNEPWGVAVGPDGSVYVTDTWNHRVQKFTTDGKPITMWGQYGQPLPDVPESKSSFWGPRGIAVDQNGHVYVADTGNKRIAVFDSDGNYLTEFGSAGFEPGQFDEPVGVAVGNDGVVYVTDTWNQRVQSFSPSADGLTFLPLAQWDVNGWFGQSLENKPFIAVDTNNNVFITDPEGYRVIEFTSNGQFIRTWGDFGTGDAEIGLASGVNVDANGDVWVTDAVNNRILKYKLPQ
jgi:predicted membrane-bound mannosyltransferase/streptogramin lyase